MLLPSDLHDIQTLVTQVAQRVIESDTSTPASTRFEACAAIATAVHDALRAVKTQYNDDIAINKLPPEVLGSIFFQLTIGNNRPLRVLTRASVVCRHWRDVAISTPQLWTRLEDDYDDIPFELLPAWLSRSKTLPISITCRGARECTILQPHMLRITRLILTTWDSGWEYYIQQLLALPAPILETLWMPKCPKLSESYGKCAPKLQTLGVRLFAFDRDVYPSIRGVTRLHLLWPRSIRGHLTLLRLDCVLSLLRQLPVLAVLVDVTPADPTLPPLSTYVSQADITPHHWLTEVQAIDSPTLELGTGMMDSLHALGYDHIPTVSIHRPSPDTIASLFNDPTHAARPYTHVTLDRIRSQIVLRTEDGYTRALTDCKTAHHLERLLPLAATLTSLTLAGALPRNIAGLPVFPALRTFTIVIHLSDSPPSAMTKSWNSPQLKTLRLSSIKNVVSIPVALVADFISTKLVPARTLAELRLDSVKLVTTSDIRDIDPSAMLASLVDDIISTTDILEGAKVEKYGP